MSWWLVVLVVLVAVLALVGPAEMDPQAFARGLHLWSSTPQQQDRP